MNKFKKILKRIGLMFAFGMKGGDDLIKTQNHENADIGIIQTKETQNLGQALLKGEVTQQVEELRYSNYRVLRESDNYAYIGGGNAVKLKKKQKKFPYTFYQDNKHICESVTHELNRIGQYDVDRFYFKFVYKDIVKFKLENYTNYGKFTVNKNYVTIELFFDKLNKNPNDPISYMVLKELEKIKNFESKYQILNNDICSNPLILSFVTYKANGEDDLIQYTLQNLSFDKCIDNGVSYVLTFVSDKFDIVDLTEKYFSQSMYDKYEAKAPKQQDTIEFPEFKRVEKCHCCHKVMNNYDADITRYEYGHPMCNECIKKLKIDIENL